MNENGGGMVPSPLKWKGYEMKAEIKYAPQSLGEVVHPNKAVETRLKAYGAGELEGHVMLHGPNGTGKSTVGRLLIQALGGVNASIETKTWDELMALKDLRQYLLNAGVLASMSESKKHFMLLNEFDKVKKGVSDFWTALDACEDKVMAIITTNHPMEIDRSLRSRCDLIEIPAVSAASALQRIQYILRAEGLVLPDAQVLYYLKQIEHMGDLRKYLKKADELLFINRSDLPFPPWTAVPPALKVI
jgi:replication-associated recombination protein RarA